MPRSPARRWIWQLGRGRGGGHILQSGPAAARGFGALLRQHRTTAQLTQVALAARSGLSAQAIGALERGARRSPYRVTTDMLAAALDLSPEERRTFEAAAQVSRPPRAAATVPVEQGNHNLPVPPTPLVGRESDLRRATDLLRRPEVRLLTLTGCPGTGKTRLAMALAAGLVRDFPDGIFLVHLASLTDPGLVSSAIGHALDCSRAGTGSSTDTLAEEIGTRRLLLLVDNFEHLLAAAPLLADLLGQCPALHLLVTSRATLHLRGEHQLRVRPLPVPDSDDVTPEVLATVPSAELFIQRARARAPGFEVTEANAEAVAQLCRRLDGLPLALELTAAWIGLLYPSQLLERLDDCLRADVDGPRDMPEHQRTMRATLQWSYCLLSETEQALFRRLAVFAGGAPADAVEVVCQAAGPMPGSLLRALNDLVDKNMVLCEGGDDHLRVSMLEVMRTFALEQLAASGEAEATSGAHADWYLALADAAERPLRGRDQLHWVNRLELERDNLRAALRWAADRGRVELGLAIAGRLWRFWERRGQVSEGLAWLDDLLARDAEVTPGTRARALNAAGNLCRWIDYPTRAARYAASLALYRQLGDWDGIARLVNNLGMVAQDRYDHRAATELFEESLAIFRALDDDYSAALCLANWGVSAMEQDDLTGAERMLEEANSIRRRLGDSLGLARSLTDQAMVHARAGAGDSAGALFEESLALCRALGDQATLAYVLGKRGDAARDAGDDELAGADYAAALVVAQRMGAPRLASTCVEGLASLAAACQATEVAARLYGAADGIRDGCGMPHPPADDLRRGTVGRTMLDGEVSRAWCDGRGLSLPEAVEQALAWSRAELPEDTGAHVPVTLAWSRAELPEDTGAHVPVTGAPLVAPSG